MTRLFKWSIIKKSGAEILKYQEPRTRIGKKKRVIFLGILICLQSNIFTDKAKIKIVKFNINHQYNSKGEKDMFGKKKTFTLSVEGIECAICKARVEKAILGVKGVKEAEASVESKEVKVVAKESVSEESVKAAIIAAGYKA